MTPVVQVRELLAQPSSSHVPPPASLEQPSLRQCEGQPLERAPTSASTSLAVAQASSSPTSPPQPCYPSCRRRIPAIALCCTAQPPHLQRPCRTKEHESRIRQPAYLPCPAPGTILLSLLLDYRGAVVHIRTSTRQPYLASLTRRRSKQRASSASLDLKLRCPLLTSVPLCITIPARHSHHRPCTTRQSRDGRDSFPSLVQSPMGTP